MCEPSSCSPTAPQVRFPFRLDQQPRECGYPGFDLSCSNQSTVLRNLQFSRAFVVTDINYTSQSINFKPQLCPLPRIDAFKPRFGTPFQSVLVEEYTFFNCSSIWSFLGRASYEVVDCLGKVNGTAIAFPSKYYDGFLPRTCTNILLKKDIPVGFRWSVPFCGKCEVENMTCGYKDVRTLEIGCDVSSKRGLSTTAKYGIAFGGGLPALFLLVCLAIYASKKTNDHAQIQQQDHVPDIPSATIARLLPRSATGLDKLTIESYQMTVLGESKRLPKPSDSTCAICLSEYKTNDTLRTIPECNHYFHSNCIDEWLQLNATCPLCRNLRE
ncbi:hypothetical protein ACET3Z_004899 [Daucus carota]